MNYQNNDRKDVFKGSGKPHESQRYSKDSFTKGLINKVVKISLTNGKEIQGRLLELGMYDIAIYTENGLVIVMKSGILTVMVIQ